MFLNECDRFVENVYRIMNGYSCFNTDEIKEFAYCHCAAYSNFYLSLRGKRLADKYINYFFKKAGPHKCTNYQLCFKKYIEDPYEIPLNWIPNDSPFDADEYLDEIQDNIINVAELIFINFCFNRIIPGPMVIERDMDEETSEECDRFIFESMISLLDRFDEFNRELVKCFPLK